jgi:hypothetical protein
METLEAINQLDIQISPHRFQLNRIIVDIHHLVRTYNTHAGLDDYGGAKEKMRPHDQ